MAGRCGGSTCSCVLEVKGTLTKEGIGSPRNPWVLGVNVGQVFQDAAGQGLKWDSGSEKMNVCLSRDSGNSLRFGGDGCLYAPGGDTPMPDVCARPIESLPEAPGVVAAEALAGLHGPYSSPHSLEYCLAQGVDIIEFKVGTSSDDVGVVADYWDQRVSAGRTSIYVSQDIRQLSSSAITSVWNYAGDLDDPQAYNPGESFPIADRGDRRGGWYGWLAQQYRQPLVSEFLARIDGKSVAMLDCAPDPEATYPESDAIIGAIRAVQQYCAQPWAMITVREIENAETVAAAGITPVLMPLKPDTWGATDMPYPVEDVTGAGVEWMVLSQFYADAVFTAYQEADINVLMAGDSRHVTRARVADLGIRGGYMRDPVYYRGGIPGGADYGYRTEHDPWEHRRPATGQLTHRTDDGSIVSAQGLVRGIVEAEAQGLVLPAGFGEDMGRACVLCGWELPLATPDNYTLTWEMRWDTLSDVPARAKMGVLFGAETDASPYERPDDPDVNPQGLPDGQKTLYRAYMRQDGEMGIGKWASQDGSIEYLATMDTPAPEAGVYDHFELVVTPTQITLTRTLDGGAEHSVTAEDDQYRGGYFWIEKEESYAGQSANRFDAKFQNIAARSNA